MKITERQKKIQQALAEDERTQDYTFEVIDESGLITIKGKVDERDARQAAIEIAKNQAGVVKVIDDITLINKTDERVSPIPDPDLIKYEQSQ